jgi:hypothetical protein
MFHFMHFSFGAIAASRKDWFKCSQVFPWQCDAPGRGDAGTRHQRFATGRDDDGTKRQCAPSRCDDGTWQRDAPGRGDVGTWHQRYGIGRDDDGTRRQCGARNRCDDGTWQCDAPGCGAGRRPKRVPCTRAAARRSL